MHYSIQCQLRSSNYHFDIIVHKFASKETHDFNRGGNSSITLLILAMHIFLVRTMKRAILLQTCATKSKEITLREALSVATSEFNLLWDERDFCSKFMDFHRKVYSDSKKRTSFNSQVVCDIERNVWRSKAKSKGITLKFNIPR